MQLKHTLLKYFLAYAILIAVWLLVSYALPTSPAHTPNGTASLDLIHFLAFPTLTMLFWFIALQHYKKQKDLQQVDTQISLERLKLALDAGQKGLWDWSLNQQQDVFFSSAYCATLGFTQEEFGNNQKAWQNRLLPEERERIYRSVMRFIAEGDGNYDSTYRMLHKDKHPRWIRSRGRLIKNSQGVPVRFIGITQDITAQRDTEERLQQANAVFESTHEGVLITDHTNTIVHINPAFTHITGYSADDVIGQTPRMFKSGRHTTEFYKSLWTTLESTNEWSGEIWNRRKNGEILPQYQTIRLIRDENGFISHNVAIFSDISILKDSQSELNYLSHYDPLTGLANRSQLYDRLKTILQTSIDEHKNSSVFLIDLDHFKNINESLGHSLGDQLLQAVAKRISKNIHNKCTLARIGGDEFVVVCETIGTPEEATVMAQHIIQASKEPFVLNNNQLFISASIGICLFPRSGSSVEEIMRNADSALNKAKTSGRETFAFYSSELTEQAFQRIRIASELRTALETNGLQVYYQPIYAMAEQQLVGCEALVRWNHPQRGLITPNEFIPIAEENGLISSIDEWVLQHSCQQMRTWQEQGLPLQFIAVNISSRSLSNTDLPATVAKILQETGIAPQCLELEVTESAVMEDPQHADATLIELRRLGVQLAIDDFGTGYSSLARLKSLPVHKLKIDQSFVSNLPTGIEDIAIVRAILALGSSIGLKVQAEGIETTEQMRFLQQQNCPLGQGYWFGRPMPTDAFTELLAANSTIKV
ncbi:MAG TPA: EAL domain-containing protein [Gammaproteobacteria bacterium]|nr:EAL domain-containing protein [Gammaproteobacteria bacterium]